MPPKIKKGVLLSKASERSLCVSLWKIRSDDSIYTSCVTSWVLRTLDVQKSKVWMYPRPFRDQGSLVDSSHRVHNRPRWCIRALHGRQASHMRTGKGRDQSGASLVGHRYLGATILKIVCSMVDIGLPGHSIGLHGLKLLHLNVGGTIPLNAVKILHPTWDPVVKWACL